MRYATSVVILWLSPQWGFWICLRAMPLWSFYTVNVQYHLQFWTRNEVCPVKAQIQATAYVNNCKSNKKQNKKSGARHTDPSNKTARCSYAVDMKTNSTSVLRDESTLLQCVINTFNAIFLHRQQKTAAKHNTHTLVYQLRTSALQTILDDNICKVSANIWQRDANLAQKQWQQTQIKNDSG